MGIRTYHDPLHGGISLDSKKAEEEMIIELIESSPFQRLRRIRQLGPAYLTFHGAESSRFTHSLGVFHLARKALKKLIQIDPNLEKSKGLLYAAALLHDLGHGPLSHTGEWIFNLHHEEWSARLIREHSEIKETLEKLHPKTPEQIASLLESNSQPRAIKKLVSSQLDCDRLDYLIRDSYATGTCYGQLDLERIMSALTLAPDGDIAIDPKGLMAVEHYLVVRNLMYRGVYGHRLNIVCNWLLEQVIRLAKKLGPKRIWADQIMSIWLWHPEKIDIEVFLANDDIRTFYHLERWKEDAPKDLSELCKRVLDRRLLKAINVAFLNKESQLKALAISRNLSEKEGKDPDLCCGLRYHHLDGYQPYIGGLRLWDGNELTALEKASPLISSLIKPEDSSWLIYPKEIHHDLLENLRTF